MAISIAAPDQSVFMRRFRHPVGDDAGEPDPATTFGCVTAAAERASRWSRRQVSRNCHIET